jgi:hypothetical protein
MSTTFVRCCPYCGRRPNGGGIACHAHSDVLKVDPTYQPDVPQRESKPDEDILTDALLAGLNRNGA